jgi:hypothetical protein
MKNVMSLKAKIRNMAKQKNIPAQVIKIIELIIITILALLVIVGVPVAINEFYKVNSGYLTVWNGADMLSYYGTVLGAVVTVAGLNITIRFTKKQIQRESHLKSEHEKWSKIEAAFSEALDNINPIRPIIKSMDNGLINPTEAITTFQKYQMQCRTASDQLNAYSNGTDYPNIKELVDFITSAAETFFQISQKEVELYSKFRNCTNRSTAQQALSVETQYPNSFPKETLSFCEKLLQDTEGIKLSDMQEEIRKINDEMISIYETVYRPLLQKKGATFEAINTEVQRKADNILHQWRK